MPLILLNNALAKSYDSENQNRVSRKIDTSNLEIIDVLII